MVASSALTSVCLGEGMSSDSGTKRPACFHLTPIFHLIPVLLFFPLFLKQFGELEDCQINETSCLAVITYRSRPEAEQVKHL